MTTDEIYTTGGSINWKPTAYLKWDRRKTWLTLPGGPSDGIGNALVLQQLWIHSDGRDEWRDVPFGE